MKLGPGGLFRDGRPVALRHRSVAAHRKSCTVYSQVIGRAPMRWARAHISPPSGERTPWPPVWWLLRRQLNRRPTALSTAARLSAAIAEEKWQHWDDICLRPYALRRQTVAKLFSKAWLFVLWRYNHASGVMIITTTIQWPWITIWIINGPTLIVRSRTWGRTARTMRERWISFFKWCFSKFIRPRQHDLPRPPSDLDLRSNFNLLRPTDVCCSFDSHDSPLGVCIDIYTVGRKRLKLPFRGQSMCGRGQK